jgi:hypothetical protein
MVGVPIEIPAVLAELLLLLLWPCKASSAPVPAAAPTAAMMIHFL